MIGGNIDQNIREILQGIFHKEFESLNQRELNIISTILCKKTERKSS